MTTCAKPTSTAPATSAPTNRTISSATASSESEDTDRGEVRKWDRVLCLALEYQSDRVAPGQEEVWPTLILALFEAVDEDDLVSRRIARDAGRIIDADPIIAAECSVQRVRGRVEHGLAVHRLLE